MPLYVFQNDIKNGDQGHFRKEGHLTSNISRTNSDSLKYCLLWFSNKIRNFMSYTLCGKSDTVSKDLNVKVSTRKIYSIDSVSYYT